MTSWEITPEKPTPKAFNNEDPELCDYIPAEVTLETLGFFTPSSKRTKQGEYKEKAFIVTHEDGSKESLTIQIFPNVKTGLPLTIDHDYYRAFQKLLADIASEGADLPTTIEVPSRRLILYAGKSECAKERKNISAWFDRMVGTVIKGKLYHHKDKKYKELRGPVFSQVVTTGQELPDGRVAETNYVWLAPFYRDNFASGYLRPVDLEFHKRLKTSIAKALYPLLETGWYASGNTLYKKRYSALCKEFLLKEYKQLSRIKQQLESSFHELKKEAFLKHWSFERQKDGSDWVISFWPGERFFRNQAERLKRKQVSDRIRAAIADAEDDDKQGYEQLLLEDILAVCGDERNAGAYIKLIRSYPESIIRASITETRLAERQGKIKKTRGAYFTDTVKRLAEMRKGAKKSG